jgi:DNA-binding NarL/FixJ family response regulator
MGVSYCVLIAEPNPLLAEKSAGLAGRYQQVWCVAQVSSASGLENAALALRPQLIFADLGLLQFTDSLRAVRASVPHARVLALVDSPAEPYVSAATRLGADGVADRLRLAEILHGELSRLLAAETDHSGDGVEARTHGDGSGIPVSPRNP